MTSKKGKSSGGMAVPAANAWSRPLQPKARVAPPPGLKKPQEDTPNNFLRDRFLHLSLSLVGQKVTLKLLDGVVLEGIFHTFTPFSALPADKQNKYVIKACKVLSGTSDAQDGSTVIIPAEKVATLMVKSIRLDIPNTNTSSSSAKTDPLRTDTEISTARGSKNRDLVQAGSAWTNSRADALMGGDARKGPTTSGLGGTIGEWDQFKANEQLFNVSASYDENLYTTELDKTQIDSDKIARAERIAREIASTSSTNIHVAEERGHMVQTDYDEEDLYSGVLKKEPSNNENGEDLAKETETAAEPVASKKMNYAAAAAKADAGRKATPPGFAAANTNKTATPDSKTKEAVKVTPDEKSAPTAETPKEETVAVAETKDEKQTTEESKPDKEPEEKDKKNQDDTTKEGTEVKPPKITSKLNAKAKEFTFNPGAKSFVPGGITPAPVSAPLPTTHDGHFIDPNTGMAAHVQGQPHYMHGAPMGQPGMVHMMNPQFPGMRYPPGPYAGMEQHVHMQQQQQQQQQQQHAPNAAQYPSMNAPTPEAGSATASGETSPAPPEDDTNTDQSEVDASHQPSPPQPPQSVGQPQQHQMQAPYGAPPAYYAAGGMPMHQRPGGPMSGPYHPHYVSQPQQIPMGPGGAPYRQMYPMQPGAMHPNMQMRGPSNPYYPGGPMQYPQNAYHMEDGDSGYRGGRGGRGQGRGGRRTHRRGGRGGRGGYSYNNAGRQQPQQGNANSTGDSANETNNDGQ